MHHMISAGCVSVDISCFFMFPGSMEIEIFWASIFSAIDTFCFVSSSLLFKTQEVLVESYSEKRIQRKDFRIYDFLEGWGNLSTFC